MASEILSRVAQAELECEEKINSTRQTADRASEIAKRKAEEKYNEMMAEAKESAKSRLQQANEYADVIRSERQKRTEEEIDELKKQCQSKESPTVLELSKKILELA